MDGSYAGGFWQRYTTSNMIGKSSVKPGQIPSDNSDIQILDLPLYRSVLGDAMWPGDEIRGVFLRNMFSEMLQEHLDKGFPLSGTDLMKSLAEFVPISVRLSRNIFKERELARWNREGRPAISRRIEEFLIDGGWVLRCRQQCKLVMDLEALGVLPENNFEICRALASSGDWHQKFLNMVEMGRLPGGIRLSHCSKSDTGGIADVMEVAGFSQQQIKTVFASLPMVGAKH